MQERGRKNGWVVYFDLRIDKCTDLYLLTFYNIFNRIIRIYSMI